MRVFIFATIDVSPFVADEPLRDIERRSLQPLLAILEFNEHLRLTIAASHRLWSGISAESVAKLRACIERGQLTTAASLAGDPFPALLSAADVKEHLESTLSTFEKLGLPRTQRVWLPDGYFPAFGEAASDLAPQTLIVPARRLITGEAGAQLVQLDGMTRPTLCLALPEPLFADSFPTPIPFLNGEAGPLSCFELSFSENHLLPDASVVALRHQLSDSFQQLRGERAACSLNLTELLDPGQLSSLGLDNRPQPKAATLFHSPEPFPVGRRLAHLRARLENLALQIEPLPNLIAHAPNEIANRERLALARQLLREAKHRGLFLPAETAGSSPRARRYAFDRLIRAQVEIDTIRCPEVDPTVGWVQVDPPAAGADVATVQTQLLQITFDASLGGGLTSFEYKPRKHDFVNTYHPDGLDFSGAAVLLPGNHSATSPARFSELLSSALLALPARRAELAVTRQTKDLAALRVRSSIAGAGATPVGLFQQYFFKAGIGAHLNNATTGWSCEYWLEGPAAPPPSSSLVTVFSLIVPSTEPRTCSVRCLTAAGGTSTTVFGVEQPMSFGAVEAPGGCFGLRLIDGIDGLLIELRSAKQLSSCYLFPLVDPRTRTWNGVTVAYVLDAARVFEDQKSNTIFVSIK